MRSNRDNIFRNSTITVEDIIRKDGRQAKGYSSIKILAFYKEVLEILQGRFPLPKVVEVFPTNYCNFSCIHCRSKSYHGPFTNHIDFALLSSMVDELKSYGVDTLEFSGGGEPLVHPEIMQIFEMFVSKGMRLGLITNGYPFIEATELQSLALACCDWIRFSLDGFTDQVYERIHGLKGAKYSILKSTIMEMLKIRGSDNVPSIGIKMLISTINEREIDIALQEALEIKPDYIQFKVLGNHEFEIKDKRTVEETVKSSIEKFKSTNSKISTEFSPSYGDQSRFGSCILNPLHAMIDWDGTLYLCAFFEHRKNKHSFGNIRNGGFLANWVSERHIEATKNITNHECVPNCPISRYNPVVEFIATNSHFFKYV